MFNLQVSPRNFLRTKGTPEETPEETIKGKLGRQLRLGSRQVAVQTIAYYQRYLSPLKGYHCAHRLLHGGLSCSEYVKQTIASQGFRRSLPLCRDRFQACREALETLKFQKNLRADHALWRGQFPVHSSREDIVLSEVEETAEDPPVETATQGEYYADPELNPSTPPPKALDCCLCGGVEVCCGGPTSAGGMGCGDPLEGCSCCWDGCNLEAFSCCL